MRNSKFRHVVVLVAKCDEVVVDTRLILSGVVEVEELNLDVIRCQLFQLELGNLFEEALLLDGRHAPDNDNSIVKQEYFRGVHLDVEVRNGFCDRFITTGTRSQKLVAMQLAGFSLVGVAILLVLVAVILVGGIVPKVYQVGFGHARFSTGGVTPLVRLNWIGPLGFGIVVRCVDALVDGLWVCATLF